MLKPVCDLESAIAWFREELRHCEFGEVALRAILHQGRLARIESITVRKEVSIKTSDGDPK